MSSNPINLTVRFLLEIAALVAISAWGWYQSTGWERYLYTGSLFILTAFIWGTFRVDNDPKKAPVKVSGIIRLIIEILILGGGVVALFAIHADKLGWIMVILLVLHYIVSYDRVIWLLRQ